MSTSRNTTEALSEYESSPSTGHREVTRIMIDPTPERPETMISRLSKEQINAYAEEGLV